MSTMVLSIAHVMSTMVFLKYLPRARPKMFPKLRILRIYQNLAHLIFQVCRYLFDIKNSFRKIFKTC